MNKKVRCFDCVFCSEHYPSMKDVCDVDEHIILDVYSESCDEFSECEEEQC